MTDPATSRQTKALARGVTRALLAVAAFAPWIACSQAPGIGRSSGDGGARADVEIDAPLPLGELSCDGTPCVAPDDNGELDETACCLEDGGCGVRARAVSDECKLPGGPGAPSPDCPALTLPGGVELQGCCTPWGTCGRMDRFGLLGCVETAAAPGSEGGTVAGGSCELRVDARCRSLVRVTCDGPEDCGDGERCCGRSNHGLYDQFECRTRCQDAGGTETWFEICSPGARCDDGHTCEPSEALPPFLGRCYARPAREDAGGADGSAPDAAAAGSAGGDGGSGRADARPLQPDGVLCGGPRCAIGETCCVRPPEEPYCAPAGAPCRCGAPPRDAATADAAIGDGAIGDAATGDPADH